MNKKRKAEMISGVVTITTVEEYPTYNLKTRPQLWQELLAYHTHKGKKVHNRCFFCNKYHQRNKKVYLFRVSKDAKRVNSICKTCYDSVFLEG